MSMTMDYSIKRWTAKRKTALVIEIIQGKTTVAEASRSFDLAPSEIEGWVEDAKRGLENSLRAHPHDIREQYLSNKGSIYGVVSDRFKNLAFKAPKQSVKYPNLFFVGGSVNPGGGMPMVILCGQNVAKKVVAWDRN